MEESKEHWNTTEIDTTNIQTVNHPTIININTSSTANRKQKRSLYTKREDNEEYLTTSHCPKYQNQDINGYIHKFDQLFNRALLQTELESHQARGTEFHMYASRKAANDQQRCRLRTNRVVYADDIARANRRRPPDPEDPESVGAVTDVG